MRKLIVKFLALSYFFEIFGKVIQIPRIVPLAAVTFLIGAVFAGVNTDSYDILFFLPFILINLVNLIYFRVNPINFKDWDLLENDQKMVLFAKSPEFNNSKPTANMVEEAQMIKEIFDQDHPNYNEKESAWGSIILMLLYLVVVGFTFWHFGVYF